MLDSQEKAVENLRKQLAQATQLAYHLEEEVNTNNRLEQDGELGSWHA